MTKNKEFSLEKFMHQMKEDSALLGEYFKLDEQLSKHGLKLTASMDGYFRVMRGKAELARAVELSDIREWLEEYESF